MLGISIVLFMYSHCPVLCTDNMRKEGNMSNGKFNKLVKTSLGFDDTFTPSHERGVPLPPSSKVRQAHTRSPKEPGYHMGH
eukprot:c24663_g1_i4 orf=235-477(-)